MNKIFLLIILLVFKITVLGQTLVDEFKSQQLLVVKTNNWNNTKGRLTVYEWKNDKWNPVLQTLVVVGRKGLAWGKGLHSEKFNTGTLKKEGDGRSPAGIFPLTQLFGYSDISSKMDYLKVDTKTFCVDDPASKYYNQIVHADTVNKDWKSAETMRLKGDAYKYGIVIGYNTENIKSGNGSCIFLHLWDEKKSATAGCTAFTKETMLELFNFLDRAKNPLIIQAPKEEYNKLKAAYNLP